MSLTAVKDLWAKRNRTTLFYFVYIIGVILVALSMWMTWFVSGQAKRNSFAILELVSILTLSGWIKLFRAVWIFLTAGILASLLLLIAGFKKSGFLISYLIILFICITGSFISYNYGWHLGELTSVIGFLTSTIAFVVIGGHRIIFK